MRAKKLLIPKKVYSCRECANGWAIGVNLDEKITSYYICRCTGDCTNEYGDIPESCPLEDWEE